MTKKPAPIPTSIMNVPQKGEAVAAGGMPQRSAAVPPPEPVASPQIADAPAIRGNEDRANLTVRVPKAYRKRVLQFCAEHELSYHDVFMLGFELLQDIDMGVQKQRLALIKRQHQC